MQPPEEWFGTIPFTLAFGQGYSATSVQMTSVFATIANQGIRVEPSIVKAIVEADGTVVDTPDAERSRVVREDTARQVMAMMEAVTGDGGTAPQARIPGYRVAGKTGTAQVFGLKQGETYKDRAASAERLRDHGWFIAFSPMEQPRIALAAIVENGGFGSQSAAPAIKKVLDTYWQIEAENDPSIGLPTPQVSEQTANPTTSRESRP